MRSSTLRRTVGRICRETLVRSSSRTQASKSHPSSPINAATVAAAAASASVTSSSSGTKRSRTVEESSSSPATRNKRQKTGKSASTSSFPAISTEILDLSENDHKDFIPNMPSITESHSSLPGLSLETISDLRKVDVLEPEDEVFDLAEIRQTSFSRPSEISCLDMLPDDDNTTSPFSLESSALEEEVFMDSISLEKQSSSNFMPQMSFRSPDLDHWPMDNIRPISGRMGHGVSKINGRYDLSSAQSVDNQIIRGSRDTEEVDESLLSEYVEYSGETKNSEQDQSTAETHTANDANSINYPSSQTVFAWASRRSLSPTPLQSAVNTPTATKDSMNVRMFSSTSTTGIKRRSLWNGKARQMVSLGVTLDN